MTLLTIAMVSRFAAKDVGAAGALSCASSASSGLGAGSVASDAPSLAAWVWHLFAGDIVAPVSLQLMVASAGSQFAHGLEAAPYGAGSIGASGGKTGYGSQFTVFPETRAVIVIFVDDPDFIVEPTVSALLKAAASG